MRRFHYRTSAVLAVLVAIVGFAVPLAAQYTGEYPVGPRDLLEIKVLEAPELDGERRVSAVGTISLPLLGEVKVSGLSAAEIRDFLQRELTSKFVNRANVSVVVKDYANKPITVLGAVGRAGSLSISGNYYLLQAISQAGGIQASAGKTIYVLRVAENGLTDTLEISTKELFERSDPKWNVPIVPSDVINIPSSSVVKIFCIGEIAKSGEISFNSDDRITLLTAVSKAGGMTDRASNNIRIRRRLEDGTTTEIEVNYRKVLAGDVPDPELMPEDMLIFKESFF